VAAASEHRLRTAPDLRGSFALAWAAGDLARRLRKGDPDLLQALLRDGSLRPEGIGLTLDGAALAGQLGIAEYDLDADLSGITAALRLHRRGIEAKLIIGDRETMPNPALRRAFSDAHGWVSSLRQGIPLGEIARHSGHHEAHIRTRGQLAFLSPRSQSAIRDGIQPVTLMLTMSGLVRKRRNGLRVLISRRHLVDPPASSSIALALPSASAVKFKRLKYMLRQIESDQDSLRHDRSPLWIVADPPWQTRCRRGAVTSTPSEAHRLALCRSPTRT
jgi:hypothetical protein